MTVQSQGALAEAVAHRLAGRVGQLEMDKAILLTQNEELRSQLAELANRIIKLEDAHGDHLPEGTVAPSQQRPDGAQYRSASSPDMAYDGGLPYGNGANVPAGGLPGD